MRAGYAFTHPIATRWLDNDVYGHVNNVVYYSYFDTVINYYLITEGGLDIHAGAQLGLCVESHCRFAAPLTFPATVDAALRVESVGRSSVKYNVGLFVGASSQPAAEGWFVHVFVDRESRRPMAIADTLRRALEGLLV